MSSQFPAPGERVLRRFFFIAAFVVGVAAATAQTLVLDPDFNPTLIDVVSADSRARLHALADGGYLASGPFAFVGTTPAPGVARLLADGSADPGFTFAGEATSSGFANSDEGVIPLPDGRVLVYRRIQDTATGTWNTQIDGYLATGALDASFSPLTIAGGYILHVRPERNGGILLAGLIPEIDGMAMEGVARLMPDGRFDVSFVRPMAGPTSVVTSIVVGADGGFTASGSTTAPATTVNFVRRYRANGAPDTTLQPMIAPAPAAPPTLLVSPADGRLIIGGSPAVRWNLDGSIDPTFHPSVPTGNHITAAVAYDDGRLLVEYEPDSSATLPTGLSSVRLLAADGSLSTDLRSVLGETGAVQIHDITATGEVLLRGVDVTTVTVITVPPAPGIPTPVPRTEYRNPRFTPFAPNGVVGTTFRPALGLPGSVSRVVGAPNERVYVSGNFDLYDGVPVRGLIRLEADGTPDSSFLAPVAIPLPSLVSPTPLDTPVARCLLEKVLPDGRLLVTVQLQGPASPRPRFARLLADGSLDPSFDLQSALAAGTVRILDAIGDGRVLAMRYVVNASTFPPSTTSHLALFDSSGGHVRDYGTEFSGTLYFTSPNQDPGIHVREARLLPDDRVMVAGFFDHVNGITRPGVARLLADGALDQSYQPEVVPGTVLSNPRLLANGRVLASSSDRRFEFIVPQPVRLRADGRRDPAFHTVSGFLISNPSEQSDGSILDVGMRLRRLHPDGAPDLNVDVDLTGGDRSVFIVVGGAALSFDRTIIAGGTFTSILGEARFGLARLVPAGTPGFTVQPTPRSVVAGERTFLQVAVGDSGEATFQWQRNGVDLPGATSPLLVLESARVNEAGEYRAIVSAAGTTYQSNAVTIAVLPNTTRLVNFSARSRVRPDAPPQIAGFVTADTTAQPVLLRAIGPSLLQFGVEEPLLRNPTFRLYSGATPIADGESAWSPLALPRSALVGAFDLIPSDVPPFYTELAMPLELTSGIFTAQTAAATANADGVSLFEFYDAAPNSGADFVRNVSLRGRTAPGVETMIGGFSLAGNGPRTLLVRGIGAELAQWDVPDPLADSQLTLFSGQRVIATSNDWADFSGGTPEAISAAATVTGAFPLETTSKSAAILITLEPGAYTVHAVANTAGAPNESITAAGEVLLEIYVVEP